MRVGEVTAREAALGAVIAACVAGAIYEWVGSTQAQHVQDAIALGAEGRYSAAISQAQQVSVWPASARAHRVTAFALQDLGRNGEAARAFGAAIADDPKDSTLYEGRAIVLLRIHRRADAARDVRTAKRLNPRLLLSPPLAKLTR